MPTGYRDGGQWSSTGSSREGPSAARRSSAGKPNHHLSTSENGINHIKKYEDFSEKMYHDQANKPTIGYGHRIKPGEQFPARISHAEAIALLKNDISEAENAVRKHVTVPLAQHEFDALTSLAFNVGTTGFAKSRMLAMLNAGNRDGAMKELLDFNKITIKKDGKDVKVTSDGLIVRRAADKRLFLGQR